MGNKPSNIAKNVQVVEEDFRNLMFKHVPISQESRHVRILHLPQREDGHDLLRNMREIDVALISDHKDYHCTMTTASLDDKPRFKALSYTWGSAKPTCKIMVNGQPFWIASNLATAIHHITSKYSLVLWIDAICIDQRDNDESKHEKSWQIDQMVDVYRQAELVLVWLGRRTVENMRGFDTLRKLNVYELNENGEAIDEIGKLVGRVFGPTGPPPMFYSWNNWELIDSIKALLSVDWWGRIWVAQELAVASRVNFVCGYETIDAECFTNFFQIWDDIGCVSRVLDHRPWAQFEIRQRFQDHSLTIKDILQISSRAQLQATVPKDQIFGFSALVSRRVNYKQSDTTVFIEVTEALLAEAADLWFLSFCVFTSSSALPSWVPDWRAQPGVATILQAARGQKTGSASVFKASMNLEPAINIIGLSPSILQCRGIQVDMISRVGVERPAARYNYLDDRTRDKLLTWFRDELTGLLSAATTDTAYTPDERDEAIFRTLLLDNWETISYREEDHGWGLAPSVCKLYYEALVNPANNFEAQRHLTTPGQPTEQFFHYAMDNTISRLPFATKRGYLGLGLPQIEVGDVVVVLGGGDVPYVLREVVTGVVDEAAKSTKQYRLVGEAYVHGIMDGEAVAGKHEVETFELI